MILKDYSSKQEMLSVPNLKEIHILDIHCCLFIFQAVPLIYQLSLFVCVHGMEVVSQTSMSLLSYSENPVSRVFGILKG